ncbi:MAG: hypothetical protein CVU84_01955 [Firmicutes bacterium HGW-Firmicutes-1]|jgi:hypothetical protein|nr:MAG: hypothetical protein CVU84_01955 [Firmicutes bacterium HGW-Firmicutes-1]
MHTFIFVVFILILVSLIFIYEHKTKIKKLRILIKKQYGRKPNIKKCDSFKLGYYWREHAEKVAADEKIDDITWNDLEMDNVFCRINNCNSFVGEQVLYSALHCISKSSSFIELLELKISFFAAHDKEREDIQLLLCGLGKGSGSYFLPSFIAKMDAFRISGIWKYRLMQIILASSALPVIFYKNTNFLFVTLCVLITNIVIYAINKVKYEVDLDMLNSIIKVVNVGYQIADTKKYSYENEFHDLKKEAAIFKKLSSRVNILLRKKQASLSGDVFGLIFDYLIGGTLWDFIKYDQIIRILDGKQNDYTELYKKIGEVDMAITLASFRESLPLVCTPTFWGKHILQVEQIFHPLIDEPICNTVNIDKSCIITGSNASGKSTFIKAIAINVILAQSIHTCMAKKMNLPYARIITSMAVRDDLMSGESYYIKEIKYLNRIVQSLSEERLVICAIDEILRGTNTEERIAASSSILKFIDKKNCIAIVASHDIELTQILDKTYDNYHFCEQIQEKDIAFDFKIHDGVTTSRNAIKLLEYVGFPDEIIIDAKKPFLETEKKK